jgi:hypothetical protein
MKKLILIAMALALVATSVFAQFGPDSKTVTVTTAGTKVLLQDPTSITRDRVAYLSSADGDWTFTVHRYLGSAEGWANVGFGAAASTNFVPTGADSVHSVSQDYIVPIMGKYDCLILKSVSGSVDIKIDVYTR